VTRSVGKGPFVDGFLLKKAEKVRAPAATRSSGSGAGARPILPQFVGLTFGVYNGHKHVPVNVTEDMIGHKFGEFSPTPDLLRAQRRQESVQGRGRHGNGPGTGGNDARRRRHKRAS
jgi:small subunit ribosomal protein S19